MSAAACVLSLLMSAVTGDFIVFSAARLVSGIAAAFAFIAGGALAAHVAEAQATRKAFYLSLFYIGPAAGILISGLTAPFLLDEFGPGSWWVVWGVLAGISGAMALLLPAARVPEPQLPAGTATSAGIRTGKVMLYLTGYALFGAGYIAYMTFMIAHVRNAGGGAMAQSAFWTCLGAGAFAQPWTWGGILAKARSGRVTALLIAITAVGALIPLMGNSPVVLAASALIFGNAFFAVVSSTSAFARLNYPPAVWPKAIAMMTIAFGLGQTLGPIATGAITDAVGSLSYALNISTAVLVAGVIACMAHAAIRSKNEGKAVPPEPTPISRRAR
jgi:MFS family permease